MLHLSSWLLKGLAIFFGIAFANQFIKLLVGIKNLIVLFTAYNLKDIDPSKLGGFIAESLLIPIIGASIFYYLCRLTWRRGNLVASKHMPLK